MPHNANTALVDESFKIDELLARINTKNLRRFAISTTATWENVADAKALRLLLEQALEAADAVNKGCDLAMDAKLFGIE